MNRLLLSLAFILVYASTTFAQFTLSGEFRNRTEFTPSKSGAGTLVGEYADSYLGSWQRTRIIGHYKSDKLETKFSFQDVRAFGSNLDYGGIGLNKNASTLALYEGWAKYSFSDAIGLKIGRQELKFGDGRLMWHRDWNNYGFSYDAFSLEGKTDKLEWIAGFALNSVDPRDGYRAYKTLGFIHGSAKFSDAFTLNFTNLYEGNEENVSTEPESDYEGRFRNSIGINPVVNLAALTLNASVYLQMGKESVVNDVVTNYSGMMFTVNANYKVNDKISLGAGYDNYSGEAYDNDQTDNKNKVFYETYAARHLFFGNTDFNSNLFAQGRGLQDINFIVNAKFTENASLMVGFHNISYAQNNAYSDAQGNTVEFKSIGSNLDLEAKIGLGKGMVIIPGYSIMIPTDDYKNYMLGNDVNAKLHQYFWVMFKFSPTFLKMENKSEVPKE